MFCTQCGTKCESGDRFCTECGAALFSYEKDLPRDYGKKGKLWVPIAVLLVMMVIGISAFFAYRAYTDIEQPWLTLRNGEVYFDQAVYDGNGKLTVPTAIAGQNVQGLSAYCFSASEGISEICLPEGMEFIGDYAFAESTDLVAVKLPESVTEVGHGVFYGCEKLEAVYICGNVTYLGYETFSGCSALKHVFFGGTAEQWDSLYSEELPENAKVYLKNGDEYEEYVHP